jgi:hypothetical protein
MPRLAALPLPNRDLRASVEVEICLTVIPAKAGIQFQYASEEHNIDG